MNKIHILHADMDAFFSAVEQRENPELKGKAVIVGGVNLSNRGVVSTASYEARKFGVHSAMPIAQAKKLCPDGIYLPARHQLYKNASREIFAILKKYTPLVEKLSIDEAFLDVKGCDRLYGSAVEIARKIKSEVKKETELTISVGVSVNKFLAKLASDYDKPDGLTVIKRNDIKNFMRKLDIDKIWGVGDVFASKLEEENIYKASDIWPYSLEELKKKYGKAGVKLFFLSRGIDKREVKSQSQIKSISHEETFADNIEDRDRLFAYLFKMSEKVSFRLHSNSLKGSTVFIKVRYSDFSTYSRQKSLKVAVNSSEEIYQKAKELLTQNHLLNKPLRLLGLGVSNLCQEGQEQLNLFAEEEDQLDKTIDELKRKYGFNKISRARKLYLNNDD
ncbi:DNA polymerase-4 [Halanaerobium saccharolyticum]|uniref:DNA polymerase IV n=1 Tax=Halanaerobium saccharolyticum TaxID=43595 RepID=A0A4R7Z3S0_9FIRM|nr:DNA polymerase IV [Halanaerobium saccharolyticum]RAK07416.1 DNA polymerase-4 [Halanaerobium saccharolyticum]TDW02381.1 DNA polymerase-4 [Halanaerobium saccharolyticum]TDX59101.1 DNA polymerase-4 [Halanaerobium saccharolyticum]